MGLFDLFKRNKKSKTETVGINKPSPDQTLFGETVLEIIGPTVAKFGFKRHRVEIEEYFSTIIFRKNKQYIKISGTTFPTDYPFNYNLILGEGDSADFYEWDWNSIALWRLKERIDPTAGAKEFEFPFGDEVKHSVSNANSELLRYGDTFLRGDMTLFYEIRSDQNKSREAYKILSRDEDGNYKSTDEPKSVQQKKKYS